MPEFVRQVAMFFESFEISLDSVETSANSADCLITVRIFYVCVAGDNLTLPVG